MDDLAGKISEIMSDPASMEKIKNLSSMLGIGQGSSSPAPEKAAPQPSPAPAANPLGALLGSLGASGSNGGGGTGGLDGLGALLGGLGSSGSNGGTGGLGGLGGNGTNTDMLQTIMKIAPLLSNIQKEDDSTRLLYALRPFLKPERQKKLDESANMMRMFKLLPLLKGSGILGGIFG